MAHTDNLGSTAVGRYGGRNFAAMLCGFAAALGWWIGLTGYVVVGGPASGGSGLPVFLGVPVLLSAGTYLLAVDGRRSDVDGTRPVVRLPARSSPQHRLQAGLPPGIPPNSSGRTPGRHSLAGQQGTGGSLLVLTAFAAALFWWIGRTGYLVVGGAAGGAAGLGVFLGLPAVATAGTYLAVRRRGISASFKPGRTSPWRRT
jgi:hypothetical protein